MPKKRITEEEYVNGIDKCIDEIKKLENDLIRKYMKKIKTEFTSICRNSIEEFYDDYDPIFYNRKDDLFNTYNIDVNFNKKYVEITFDSNYMKKKHRADNSYIFELSFLDGWHGGAATISDEKIKDWGKHPNEGIPYWRTPFPTKEVVDAGITPFKYWSEKYPAKQSDSIYATIMARLKEKNEELVSQMQSEYDKKGLKIIEKINKLDRWFYGG